jgi:diguanylate cyclase (GGDEF)-like protein
VLLALLLTAVLAALDLVSGPDLSLSLFYLLPIGGLAWYNGARAACLLTAASAIWWLADGLIGTLHPGVAVWNMLIRAGFFLIVVLLISRLSLAYDAQRTLAGHDPLTGLANLRSLRAALEHYLSRARPPTELLTVAYLDLDNFKQVNDRLGHAAGDAALQTVAEAIRATLRAGDLSARIGGDEFVVVLTGCDEPRAREVLERLQSKVQACSKAAGWGVAVSIGAVCLAHSPRPSQAAAVLDLADAAMYRGKAQGKGRIVVEPWPGQAMADDAHGKPRLGR